MLEAAPTLWSFFLATVVSVTIVIFALAAALVIAQRQRLRMQQRYSQRVLRAHEEERAWVATELHDVVLQRMAHIRSELETLRETLDGRCGGDDLQRLQGLSAEIATLGDMLRGVARRLQPSFVDQLGLPRALRALAQEFYNGGGLAVDLHMVPDDGLRLAPEVARTAFSIAQEALRNVVRHSGVKEASLVLDAAEDSIVLTVTDGGRGFDSHVMPDDGRLGLLIMRDRAASLGGAAVVISRPGSGTEIEVTIPRSPAQ